MRYDLIVKNGTVINAHGRFIGDVLISDGKISALSDGPAEAEGITVIDASGKIVLPGMIDPHTHFGLPMGDSVSADDFRSGTVAALAGGVTTIIDFSTQENGRPIAEALEKRMDEAEGGCACDYSFHAGITDLDDTALLEIPALVARGIPSFKVFMAYGSRGLKSSDAEIFRAMLTAGETGGLVMIHAENGDVVDYLTGRLEEEGRVDAAAHYDSRPAWVEEEAVRRAVTLAENASSPVYLVHTSVGRAVGIVREARGRGVDAILETCPHYLFLTRERFSTGEGSQYILSPALRDERDREALWRGILDGTVKTIGTDHCPFMKSEKQNLPFTRVPNGIGGVEVMFPLLASHGVMNGLIAWEELVAMASTRTAAIFGLSSRKGAIRPGLDADIIIFDPEPTWTLRADDMHSRSDFCPYEGFEMHGRVTHTILRGETVFENGEFIGRNDRGCFIGREPYERSVHDPEMSSNPAE